MNPPRLNGSRKGVFATRSPHRPNPIGLSLVRLDAVRGRSLHLSGIDLVDGTPILDIKPYLPPYDLPCAISADGRRELAGALFAALAAECGDRGGVRYPGWALPSDDSTLRVTFSAAAEAQLSALEVRRPPDSALRPPPPRPARPAIRAAPRRPLPPAPPRPADI